MELIEVIERWGTLTPQRVAHVSEGRTLTYQQLWEGSERLAAHLTRMLPRDQSAVAVLGHKENEMLIGFLGCVKAGHPYIPLDTSLPQQRIEAITEAAKSPLLLTPTEIARIIREDAELSGHHRPALDDPWYVIFTSGSTGEPKGVVITRQCLESFVEWILAEQRFGEAGEVFLNQAPFSFDLSVMDLYSSLASGGTLFSVTKDQIAALKTLYAALQNSDVSVWVSTPSFARLCSADENFSQRLLPNVRKFWFCGETLAPEVAAVLLERFPNAEVWNTYGPTEATVATTSIQITDDIIESYSPLPVGRTKPGTKIEVHDAESNPVRRGERGEIIIAGANVSIGYLNRADLTSRAFFELDGQRAYRTGDSGHFEDDLLFFDGRMDFQIKLHGYRIEIGDIEAHLNGLGTVQDAVVIAALKDGLPDHLVAFVILKGAARESDYESMKRLKSELGQRLPEYMIPRKFVFLPEFPITSNGKADRRKLSAMIA